jgi:hypothetical protein
MLNKKRKRIHINNNTIIYAIIKEDQVKKFPSEAQG